MGIEYEETVVRMIGSVLGTIILHGILLIIHRPGASRARSGQLTPEELFVGIAIFLAFKSCIVQLLMVIGSFLLIGLSVVAFNGQGEEENHQYASHGTGHMGLGFFSDNFASILRATLITWIVHLGLIYFLETGIPFCRQLLKSREKTLKKVNARLKAIYNFLKSTLNDPFSGLSVSFAGDVADEIVNSNGQIIYLVRRQTDHPNEGKRILSWKIVVDSEAMNEMKETLGPPGGFGELGFNISRDGVTFEAMGVGTSFNLMFKLMEEGNDRLPIVNKSKRKRK
ncbi:hypothetical protein NA56DRAFT_648846 [Hyaloscypha hepaticicola]|uniref:Uncharacterized protein n=1 Tax=Hyaloscypha hepaticicola TaxID=2082293 RepID=A0A2J6PSZ2_9HELO|nr:hypothetical protein NA56DRAFT_648846 [Hyaloscypha hepaticicola]